MNGVGFEILARTPIPKLPLSYLPPPPPPPPRATGSLELRLVSLAMILEHNFC